MSNDLKIECLTETELTLWEKVAEDKNFAENLPNLQVDDAFFTKKSFKDSISAKVVDNLSESFGIKKTNNDVIKVAVIGLIAMVIYI